MTAKTTLLEKFGASATKLTSRLRGQGTANTLGWFWYQLHWRIREWKLGVTTKEFSNGVVVDENPLPDIPWLKHEYDLPTGHWPHARNLVYVANLSNSEPKR